MPLSKILAAVGISLLAIAAAAACDDYDEEMAVEAATAAAKVALSHAIERKPAAAADTSARSQPAEVAAAERQPAPASARVVRTPQ